MNLEIYSEEPKAEDQKESEQSLSGIARELALMTGAEISSEELRVSIEGPNGQGEERIPFMVAERTAQLGYKASISFGNERKIYGAQSLVLKGISYIYGSPETAEKCFDLARQVWDGSIEWSKEIDIMEPQMEVERPPLEKEEEKRAA